jgi:alkanesulfonate monooxygenase SsuD/methylene tetrahydromethanopterin reductase-like flavin-dependent oxidoreductase (luciferase family)
VPFGKPLLRTREYIAIIRQILDRKAPLEFRGEHYQIPYTGPGATGLGKPLRSIIHGNPDLQIYTAAIAPAGLRTTGEVADGTCRSSCRPRGPRQLSAWCVRGSPRPGGKTLADFDLAPYVRVSMGEDLAACRDAIRPQLALYIGGMGARSKNYYNDLTRRLGYEAAAADIQDHFLAGQRKEAEAAVPDTLSDEISLVGSKERIHDRLQVWKELAKDHRVGSLVLTGGTPEALHVVAEAVL